MSIHYPVIYNQIIGSKNSVKYIDLCAIKDQKNNFICKPMPVPIYFDNYDEYTEIINKKTTEVYKIDRGTNLFIYTVNDSVKVATRTNPEANNNYWRGRTFENIINNLKNIILTYKTYTHTFTLTEKNKLIYIGSVNNKTLQIKMLEEFSKFDTPQKVNISEVKAQITNGILESYDNLGYIIRDNEKNRWYIIKSSLYYAVDKYFGKINDADLRKEYLELFEDETLKKILEPYI